MELLRVEESATGEHVKHGTAGEYKETNEQCELHGITATRGYT